MNYLFFTAILVIIISYYMSDSFFDVYYNFGVYFPFFNIKTYLDLLKFVVLPRFKSNSSERLFTVENLQQYGGNSKELYLSLLGNVFDVSNAASYYGTNQMYNGFTGRDGSRAFITGDFSESGLTDDVLDLPLQDLKHLKEWLKMYKDKYKYLGKLVGKYFDRNGNPTDYHEELMKRFEKAEKNDSAENEEKQMFPPCNVEWAADKGSRVWCSMRSGGIERDWVGVPRKLYIPGSNSYRCACINQVAQQNLNKDNFASKSNIYLSKYVMEYENCDVNSYSCFVET